MKACIGADLGLTESGICVFPDNDDADILAWATFSCTNTSVPDLSRVLSLAEHIIDMFVKWIHDFDISELDIGIELPVSNVNPKGYAKQNRLIQEVESGIAHRIAPEVQQCFVTEIYPTTSKLMACNYGKASKAQVLAASPFGKGQFTGANDTLETLGDAWSHGLSCWPGSIGKVADRIDMTQLKAVEVKCGKVERS